MTSFELYCAITLALLTHQLVNIILLHAWMNDWSKAVGKFLDFVFTPRGDRP
jgi:hypothetical protein